MVNRLTSITQKQQSNPSLSCYRFPKRSEPKQTRVEQNRKKVNPTHNGRCDMKAVIRNYVKQNMQKNIRKNMFPSDF